MGLAKLHITIPGLHWLFTVCLLGFATNAFADSAPETVGQFTRSDGVVLTAVEQQIDALFYFTGVNCWLTLPDNTQITVPHRSGAGSMPPGERDRSCVIRVSDNSAEIYRYNSDVLPVANRILQFDGYTFTDVTTSGKRWLSPLLHTWDHLGDYLAVIAFFAVLALLHLIGKWFFKPRPERGWWLAVRSVWFISYVLTALTCGFLLLFVVTGWSSPTSPLVFLVLFATGLLVFRSIKMLKRFDR